MDTAVLRELLGYEGPFASVYFDGSHDTEDADKELELRWRAIRQELSEAGAPLRTLTALEDVVLAGFPPVGRAGRFLVAAGDAVPIDEYLPEVPVRQVARMSHLPYVVPLVNWPPRSLPHVVVLVDKTGAEIRAEDVDGKTLEVTVSGSEHTVHKVRGGGWSHGGIQHHAEETVKHNIARVAEQTAQLVRESGARLLIIAGDVEPEAMLRKALPPSCQRIVAEIHTGAPTTEVAELVSARWQVEHDEQVAAFHAELARPGGLAVQGFAATVAALREANVATLMIAEIANRPVWTAEEPYLVALDPAELDALGASERIESRADEALPAAAIAVGAGLLADSNTLTDGVGALLRHGS